MSNQRLTYPLLPFSQLVYEMTRWWPKVYTFPMTYVWPNGAKERDRIESAIRTAVMNHPVFSARIDWRRRQYPSFLKDILHGPYHDIEIKREGEDAIIQIKASRILGDGRSAEILMEDIQHAYANQPLERDDYWGYLEYVEQQKQSQHYAESKVWLESEFSDTSIPVRPTLDKRLWTILLPKVGLCQTDYSDLLDKINQLAETEFLSMDGFFSLCAALAITEYCDTNAAALTWAYVGRERPEEQRIFGSLHRDVPFVINIKGERLKVKGDLIREARNQIRSGIAHSDYPYTLTKPYSNRWNYAVNVLRVPDMEYKQKYAYALLDVEIHEKAESLQLVYRYSATHYKSESIRRFAALVRKYVEWLLEK